MATPARGLRPGQVLAHAFKALTVIDQAGRRRRRHRDDVEFVAQAVAPAADVLAGGRLVHVCRSWPPRSRASWFWMVRTLTPSACAVRERSLPKWESVLISISRSISA